MKGKISAFFDMDGTLTRVRSLESSFIAFLMKNRVIGSFQVMQMAGYFLKTFWKDPTLSLTRNKMYLKGISRTRVERLAGEFVECCGRNLLHPEGVRLLHEHADRGHINILVTGSLGILVEPLARNLRLPFARTYATRLRERSGRMTGEIDGIHFYGESKRILAIRLADELDISLSKSYCYADAKSDIPLLDLFGHPVATNPDRYLAQAAVRNNWTTLLFEKKNR